MQIVDGQFDDASEDESENVHVTRLDQIYASPVPALQKINDVSKYTATNLPQPQQPSQPLQEPNQATVINDEKVDEQDEYEPESDEEYGTIEDHLLHGGGACTTSTNSYHNLSISSAKLNLSHSVSNVVSKMQRLEISKSVKHTGRDDRATVEQCLDPRTRLILFKLLNSGFLEKIDGCLSTGKEANVYYARGSGEDKSGVGGVEGSMEYAIKIFKTSILVFKDRDRYISGEYRYRKGYCKSNPRKMIKIWAEKEMRNYKRIYEANIPCPRPIMVKSNILLMTFLGKDGWPSPRLRDVTLPPKRQREAYIQCLRIMRHMFHRCKLVHGDLSEYNLLWHDNRVYVIDVSQSVEHDHPSALDFLRADCRNVNDFFRKNGDLPVMSTRQLFEFVTDVSIGVEEWEEDEALDRIMESVEETTMRLSSVSGVDRSKEEQKEMVNDSVFMNSFIPRSLNQVAEQDLERVRDGHVEDTYAKAIGALTPAIHVEENDSHPPQPLGEGSGMASLKRKDSNDDDVRQVQFKHDEDEMKENDDHFDGETDDEDDENYDEDGNYIKVPMTPEQVKAAKEAKRASNKLNKKAVKEAQAEKRLTKIKKKDKKRAINKCKAGNKNRK